MTRIVSLLPSATEIVCALGFGRDLVGRSHECDYPPDVKQLPVLTSPKFDPDGTSVQVNKRVEKILADALSVYSVDAPLLRELKPDVIVTQSQCEVCAVSLQDVEEAVAQWVGGALPKIISLAPYSLNDVLSDIERTGIELGAPARGREVADKIRDRMGAIERRASEVNNRPSVACIEWIEPLMGAGNWMPELIVMAGGRSMLGEPGRHSSWIQFQEFAAKNPEVIMIAPCGFDMERTALELPALTSRPEWNQLEAVRAGRVYLAEGNQYFNRPGPRIAESLEILAEIVHPRRFSFGHEGSGWRRVA